MCVSPAVIAVVNRIVSKFVPLDGYSLVVAFNTGLQQLDFSSLETISSGGLIFFNNPDLCYVGNFSTYLENPPECISTTLPPRFLPARRDPQMCSEFMLMRLTCDSEKCSIWSHHCCVRKFHVDYKYRNSDATATIFFLGMFWCGYYSVAFIFFWKASTHQRRLDKVHTATLIQHFECSDVIMWGKECRRLLLSNHFS